MSLNGVAALLKRSAGTSRTRTITFHQPDGQSTQAVQHEVEEEQLRKQGTQGEILARISFRTQVRVGCVLGSLYRLISVCCVVHEGVEACVFCVPIIVASVDLSNSRRV